MDKGYYVMTYGGGTYTSVAWFATKQQAEKEKNRIIMIGHWSCKLPIVEKA